MRTFKNGYFYNKKYFGGRQGIGFVGEEYRQQQQSIDLYNILLHRIKCEEVGHPEQLTIAKILKERNETELLYSLVVNA